MTFRADDDEEDGDDFEGYFSEVLDDATLTDKTPKFFVVQALEESTNDYGELKVNDLIVKYREVRDQLATDRKAYKAREARMKMRLSIISMNLRDKGDQLGVDNFKTEFGTAYRNKKEQIRVADWQTFLSWMIETGNWHLVQKRVSPLMVKEVRDAVLAELKAALERDPSLQIDLAEALPPGLLSVMEEEFAVRSPTSRKSK